MSQHTPFVFGAAGTGQQPAPALPSQHHQNTLSSASNTPTARPVPASPAQRSAFQQNAQLPGIDMSALAGISPDQVALIAQLLQSGALPLPPPPPGAPALPAQTSAATAQANQPPPQPASATQEDRDVDKEEGEIEEGEVGDTALPRARSPLPKDVPTGPRNSFSRNTPRHELRRKQSAGVAQLRDNIAATSNGVPVEKEKQSKDFILAMHQAGYNYIQLAQMVEDPRPLRRMFQRLGLSVSSDSGLSSGVQSTKKTLPRPQPVTSPDPSSNVPSAGLPQKPTNPPPPPKQTAKVDRSAYLAKLQALKAGKSGAASNQSMPQDVPDAPPAEETAASSPAQQTAAAPTPVNARPTPTSKAVKTELARQRLEAFKAERAAKQQSMAVSSSLPAVHTPALVPKAAQPSDSVTPATQPSNAGLGAGLGEIAGMVVQPTLPPAVSTTASPFADSSVFSPTPPTPNGSFGGIPGLFMNSVPQQASPPVLSHPARTASQPLADAASSTAQSTIPRKRLMTTHSSGVPAHVKRPFGQSRSASEDESFIIEDSDDEEEDARVNIGSAAVANDQGSQPFGSIPSTQNTLSAPGLQASALSASAADASGTSTYEQKMQEIEAMNRRIAAAEAKSKAQMRTPVSKGAGPAGSSGLPGIATPSRTASASLVADQQVAPTVVSDIELERSASAAALGLKEKEELTQRVAQLKDDARLQAEASADSHHSGAPVLQTASRPASSYNGRANQAGLGAHLAHTPVDNPAQLSSDDGEVEDESDFDFYGDEEPPVPSKPVDGQAHVGSQATTGSAVTEVEAMIDEPPAASLTESPSSALVDEDAEMYEVDLAQESDAGAADNADETVYQPAAADDRVDPTMPGLAQTQPTPPASDVDMDSRDSDSDDSSEDSSKDDPSDLDQPVQPADHDDHMAASTTDSSRPHASNNGDDQSGGESPDTSSTSSDSGEYEPEPADDPAKGPVVSQIEGVADDELAPELQPTDEARTALEQSDQVRSTFDRLHGN